MERHGRTGQHDGAPRIPQLPALDGLRGLAVAAVVLWHAQAGPAAGGFLGVESFFVVSGYLITALLLAERERTGGVRLGRFWHRRARRLLPALAVLLVTVLAAFAVAWPEELARIRGDVVAAALYVSNWYLVVSDQSYFQGFGRDSPFQHLWSLGVEEQFYVLWPLLLAGLFALLRRRQVVAVAVGAGALGSAAAVWLAHRPGTDPSRLYYGTDTRAAGLLLGCVVALLWRPWTRATAGPGGAGRAGGAAATGGPAADAPAAPAGSAPPRWADPVAAAGLAVLGLAYWRLAETSDAVYRGGLHAVSAATAAVVAGTAVRGGRVERALGARWLTALGRRSYSVYLWHWPVFVVTRPGQDVDLSPGTTLVVRLALTAALAEASYRAVELPARSGGIGRAAARLRATLAHADASRRRQVRRAWTAIAATGVALLGVLTTVTVLAEQPPPIDQAVSTDEASRIAAASPDFPSPDEEELTYDTVPGSAEGSRGLGPQDRVYAVGDSVMLGARTELIRAVPRITINARLSRRMAEGAQIVAFLARRGELPGVVVVHLGANGPATEKEVASLVDAAGPDRRVVLVTNKVPRRWESTSNSAILAAARGRPNVVVVDWGKAWSRCPGDVLYDDGTHLRPDGARCYAAMIRRVVEA